MRITIDSATRDQEVPMSRQDDRRASDRRTVSAAPYAGPERRIGDRRLPDSPPGALPDLSSLSDLDLMRAYQRSGGLPSDTYLDALVAEIERRELDR